MKVLYFDCFSGISGDMAMAALLDLGVDRELLKKELEKLNLDGYELIIERKAKSGIYGTDVTVKLSGDHENDHSHEEHSHDHHEHRHDHPHDHHHDHEDSHNHSHHDGKHDHHHHEHEHSHTARNLLDIEALIDESDLKLSVKEFSKKVFREIAKAEAKVHNKNIEEVHFHEVGAVDSIVDIVGVSICLDILGIDKVISSPLHDGHGFIKCRHGIIPVPVPAVMEMLTDSNIPLVSEDVSTELITPTGMGIIKCLTREFGSMPAMKIAKIGYGMGKRETGRFNALRVVMGTLLGGDSMAEEIAVLETNIDDMSPELLGYTTESLMENGALDVFYTPIYMKKNRPAVMLTVISKKELEEKLVDIIMRETSTLGIRRKTIARYFMKREIITVDTQYGSIRVKVASSGDIRKYAPEYEDCREAARKSGRPIGEIYNLVNMMASQHAAK